MKKEVILFGVTSALLACTVYADERDIFGAISSSVPRNSPKMQPLFSNNVLYRDESSLIEAVKRGEFSKIGSASYKSEEVRSFLQSIVFIIEEKSGVKVPTLDSANQANDDKARKCWKTVGFGGGSGLQTGGSSLLSVFNGITAYHVSRLSSSPPIFIGNPAEHELKYAADHMKRIEFLCPLSDMGVAKPYKWFEPLQKIVKEYSDATSSYVESVAANRAAEYALEQERLQKERADKEAAEAREIERIRAEKEADDAKRALIEKEEKERKDKSDKDRTLG